MLSKSRYTHPWAHLRAGLHLAAFAAGFLAAPSPSLARVHFNLNEHRANTHVQAPRQPEFGSGSGIGEGVTHLSQAQIDAFTPFAYLASAAYCQLPDPLAWDCGENCQGVPDFVPTAKGGDVDDGGLWYVGFEPSLKAVVAAVQGVEVNQLLQSILGPEAHMVSLDPSLFPGVDSSVRVLSTFAEAHAKSASEILGATEAALQDFNTDEVVLTGNSQGAAVSLLNFPYIPLNLPRPVNITFVGFGLPRVGNEAFADAIDARISEGDFLTWIYNEQDPVPFLPPAAHGFRHPSGEVHILGSGGWVACEGQENPSPECSAGGFAALPDLAHGNENAGPYNGVTMGCT